VRVHAETWKVLPEWFAFNKLAWFQLTFLLVKFLYSKITHPPVHIQPWQNDHRKDHGSKIIQQQQQQQQHNNNNNNNNNNI
jgi:hypothetical protein